MKLQSLVLCSDENILRVLRRVLSDLEISVDHCTEGDAAIHKLTRQRYEAIIVDFGNEQMASQVLRGARAAPCNKRAVVVAILDPQKTTRSVFEQGAHFVLYKPISSEKAKTSFRAARAMMKRERRRNTRLPVEIPVTVSFDGEGQRTVTSDISEGGIAVQPAPSGKHSSSMTVTFTLPGTVYKIECAGEVAWANSTRQAGIRFKDMPVENLSQLKEWLESQAPELESDDPPVPCKLTDLSPAGGYLETAAPFPLRSKVSISIATAVGKVHVLGIVRVAHPEVGMGVEFLRSTSHHQQQLQKFIAVLINAGENLPEILVQPEGLEDEEKAVEPAVGDDPLISFFRKQADLPAEAFLGELRKRRGSHAAEPSGVSA
jgi:CheY-like chemotaxis protein